MKQVVQNFRTGQLMVDDLPPPALRPGGVLVKTSYSLISAGTERTTVETAQSSLLGKIRERPDKVKQVIDTFKREGLRATYEKVKARLNQVTPMGYSSSGVVLEAGEGVAEFRPGDRVACAGAGYASHSEINFVPKNLCALVPSGVSMDAACYTTVGAIALQGVRQAEPRLGEVVAVTGLGLVGQLTVQILKAAGCRVLGMDIDQRACALAAISGADAVAVGADEAKSACESLSEGRGADSVLITAGAKSDEPIELAADLARDRGRVVVVGLVGMKAPRQDFYMKELELRLSRSYGPGRYDPQYEEKGVDYPIGYVRWTEKRNMEEFLRLVNEGKVNTQALTTHRFNIDQAEEAYDAVLGKDKAAGGLRCGVVLEYAGLAEQKQSSIVIKKIRTISAGEIGIGFIGAGNFARGVLLPIVKSLPRIRLTGVATATGVSGKNTAEMFGFSYATTDYEKILEDEQTSVVFIATRHATHARLAAECLKRGKAVFVEKPLAVNEDDLRTVAAAIRETGGLLTVGYNRRFAPIAAEVKQRLAARKGPMTVVYRVNAGKLPANHWTHDEVEGGGRVIGEVCHFIDFIQYLTDSLPSNVFAEAAGWEPVSGSPDDSIIVSLGMADGSIASIVYSASGDSSVEKERIEIFRGGSIARIDDFKSGAHFWNGRESKLGARTQDKGHKNEIEALLSSIRGQSDAAISADSLLATSLATFAAVASVRSGRRLAIDLSTLNDAKTDE